jgi:hypothetical protein
MPDCQNNRRFTQHRDGAQVDLLCESRRWRYRLPRTVDESLGQENLLLAKSR